MHNYYRSTQLVNKRRAEQKRHQAFMYYGETILWGFCGGAALVLYALFATTF